MLVTVFRLRTFFVVLASLLSFAVTKANADTAWDFGGMYGYANGSVYVNPATNAASCPSGYSAYQVYGTPNVDWSMYFCGRQHVAGREPSYDFGGMIGLAGSISYYAVPWKGYFYYVNPFTHTDACPPSYTETQVLGTPQVDNNLFYCWRPHSTSATSAVMYFGGMTGDGSTPYNNPATGAPITCPAGYSAYPALGTPNVDYRFFYCGQLQNASTVAAGTGSLGIGEEMVEDENTYGWSITDQVNAVNSNGINARVVRLWTLSDDLLSSPTQINSANMALAQKAVSQLQSSGVTVIAMDGRYPAWMTGGVDSYIPCRNTTPGSAYETFLNNYAQARATMAQALSTIQFWEPANETNGLLYPDTSTKDNLCPGHPAAFFNAQEAADITTDLMYVAHAAIHAQIPNATVFLPPPSPWSPNSSGQIAYDGSFENIATFVSDIYTDIDSGGWPSTNARDYFDGGSWHPYIYVDATPSSWISPNQMVYNVFAKNGDGNIPFIFSETGYNVCVSTPTQFCTSSQFTAATWMADAITLSQQNFPWLTYFIYFRAFEASDSPGYGIMSRPSSYLGATWFSTATSNASTSPPSGFCYFTGCNYPGPRP
jgi:hypothetical protein